MRALHHTSWGEHVSSTASLAFCRFESKCPRCELHIFLVHLLVYDVLRQDLLDHTDHLRIAQVIRFYARGRQQLVQFSLVFGAPRAFDQNIHIDAFDELDLGVLNLNFALIRDFLDALSLEVVDLQQLVHIGQVHVEDGAIRHALVEVKAEELA